MPTTNNSDQTNGLAESYANVETAAVNGVERKVPDLQILVTPPEQQKSTQKRIPHTKSGLVIKSARVRMCQKQCIGRLAALLAHGLSLELVS